MKPTDVKKVVVYCGDIVVGTMERTPHGSTFRYADDYQARSSMKIGVAFHIPPTRQPVETKGVNLHPYFAGLLPEGLRLSVLTRRVKTSADDLFSLLVALGSDCIGDVAVVLEGETLKTAKAKHADPLALRDSEFKELLRQSVDPASEAIDPVAIPGVQEKVSDSMITFPLGSRSRRKAHILKLCPPAFPRIVENEEFFLKMAKGCGIKVNEAKIVYDRTGESGLLITRFDRVFENAREVPGKVHVEDGCQFLDRYPSSKYQISCQEIVAGIREFATAPMVETLRFLKLYAFSYIIGNGDLHAKNVSLWRSPTNGLIELSPAYDLLTTQAYKGLDQHMAMKLGAKDDGFRAKDFVNFGEGNGIPEPAITKMLKHLTSRAQPWADKLDSIKLKPKAQSRVARCILDRCKRLST